MKKLFYILFFLLAITPLISAGWALPKDWYYPEPIELGPNWSIIGLYLNDSHYVSGDINIPIYKASGQGFGWHLIHYASETPILLEDIIFTFSGTNYTYQQAKDTNLIGGFYTQNKTAGGISYDWYTPDYLKLHDGFWFLTYTNGMMIFPGVGGMNQSISYNYFNNYRVWNGSEEQDMWHAHNYNWLKSTLYCFNTSENVFQFIPIDYTDLSSWHGCFIQALVPNLYLMATNQTNPYKIHIKPKKEEFDPGDHNIFRFNVKSGGSKVRIKLKISRLTRLLKGGWS